MWLCGGRLDNDLVLPVCVCVRACVRACVRGYVRGCMVTRQLAYALCTRNLLS